MAETTGADARGGVDDLPVIEIRHTGPGCAEVTIREPGRPRIAHVGVITPAAGANVRDPLVHGERSVDGPRSADGTPAAVRIVLKHGSDPAEQLAKEHFPNLLLRYPGPRLLRAWVEDTDTSTSRIDLGAHVDLEILEQANVTKPKLLTAFVRKVFELRPNPYRRHLLPAVDVFTRVCLLVADHAPRRSGRRVEEKRRLREALRELAEALSKQPGGRGRRRAFTNARAAIAQGLLGGIDLDHIARLPDEDRANLTARVRAARDALEIRKGRPCDGHERQLARELEALAREQTGVPLDAECGAIIEAVFGTMRSTTRRRLAERQRQRRLSTPARSVRIPT